MNRVTNWSKKPNSLDSGRIVGCATDVDSVATPSDSALESEARDVARVVPDA